MFHQPRMFNSLGLSEAWDRFPFKNKSSQPKTHEEELRNRTKIINVAIYQ